MWPAGSVLDQVVRFVGLTQGRPMRNAFAHVAGLGDADMRVIRKLRRCCWRYSVERTILARTTYAHRLDARLATSRCAALFPASWVSGGGRRLEP